MSESKATDYKKMSETKPRHNKKMSEWVPVYGLHAIGPVKAPWVISKSPLDYPKKPFGLSQKPIRLPGDRPHSNSIAEGNTKPNDITKWYIPNHNNVWNGIDSDTGVLIQSETWKSYLDFTLT